MGSESKTMTFTRDVGVILVLGLVYVLLLALGTVATYLRRRLAGATAAGRNVVDQMRTRSRSAG